MTAPAWVRDAIFYQVFPDRFAASSKMRKPANLEPWGADPTLCGFKGGDLEGVRERLDYLRSLGVDALYLNPIFASTANHRYHTHDFLQVDAILGGNDALRRLLDDAHARGMRVLLDGVFNHASRGFYQFNHTLENGTSSPYADWFHFNRAWLEQGRPLDAYGIAADGAAGPSLERFGYRAWWDLPALPKFNTSNPEVREYLFGVAEAWIRFGIDGWRLDVPNEIDDVDFWREFRARVKQLNPDAYICGEIWDDATRWLQGDQFDGVMNYLFARACLGFFFAGNLNHRELSRCGLAGTHSIGSEQFAATLAHLMRVYPNDAAYSQMNLVGSHDTPRLMNSGCGDVAGLKMVYLCLFTFPGAPCIYYGDEIGMAGGHDPDCRRGFDWDEKTWNQSVYRHVRACAEARRESEALRRGDFEVLHAHDGVVVYRRRCGSSEALVAFNAAREPRRVGLPASAPNRRAGGFAAVVTDGGATLEDEGGTLVVKLPPRAGQLWLGAPI